MGRGIAQVAVQHGVETLLFDVRATALEEARSTILKHLARFPGTPAGHPAEAARRPEQLITCTQHLRDCRATLIIEAIAENEDAKVSLFNELAAINDPHTIFASNTSSLSINSMQDRIPGPGRVIGLHFFNPAYRMQLVELVRGARTSDDTVRTAREICLQLGKTPVQCTDAPGFIVNRVARPFYLESLRLVEDQVATVEEVDTILEASGFRMGPFRLMDLIGMDINLAVSERLFEAFHREARFTPSPLQQQKVRNGELGRKTGKGFYQYTDSGPG